MASNTQYIIKYKLLDNSGTHWISIRDNFPLEELALRYIEILKENLPNKAKLRDIRLLKKKGKSEIEIPIV